MMTKEIYTIIKKAVTIKNLLSNNSQQTIKNSLGITNSGVSSVSSGNEVISTSFTTSLDFTTSKKFSDYTQTEAITFTLASVTHIVGSVIMAKVTGDSASALTFPDEFKVFGAYDNTKINYLCFCFQGGTEVWVTVLQEIVVNNASTKRINCGGYTITVNGLSFEESSAFETGTEMYDGANALVFTNTIFDTLYNSENYTFTVGSFCEYTIPSMNAGDYTIYFHTKGQGGASLQHHYINDVQVEASYNAEGGGYTLVKRGTYNITHPGGSMKIKVVPSGGSISVLAGLEIYPFGTPTAIPLS